MKFYNCMLLLSLVLCVHAQYSAFFDARSFLVEAIEGAGDMWCAYTDMREANYKHADKYFHARGNYDAAQRGPGGAWAAKIISDAREAVQGGRSGNGAEDSRLDQEANEWGRSGKDPTTTDQRASPRNTNAACST